MDNGLSNGPGLEEPSLLEITTRVSITESLEELLALPLFPSSSEEITHSPINRNASSSTLISYTSVSMNHAATPSILPPNNNLELPPMYKRTSLSRQHPLLEPLLPLLPLLDPLLLPPEAHQHLPHLPPLPQLLLPLLDPLLLLPLLADPLLLLPELQPPLQAHRHHPDHVLAVT